MDSRRSQPFYLEVVETIPEDGLLMQDGSEILTDDESSIEVI